MWGRVYKNSQESIVAKIIVDDLCVLKGHTWVINSYGYAKTTGPTKKDKQQYLHHLIMGRPPQGHCVDHKNGNKLDNRKANLQFVTRSFNNANKPKRKDSKQLFKGIRTRAVGSYEARGTGGNSLGTFKTALGAYFCLLAHNYRKFGIPLTNLS